MYRWSLKPWNIELLNILHVYFKIPSLTHGQKIPGSYGFTGEVYPTFKESITPNLHNFSQLTEDK